MVAVPVAFLLLFIRLLLKWLWFLRATDWCLLSNILKLERPALCWVFALLRNAITYRHWMILSLWRIGVSLVLRHLNAVKVLFLVSLATVFYPLVRLVAIPVMGAIRANIVSIDGVLVWRPLKHSALMCCSLPTLILSFIRNRSLNERCRACSLMFSSLWSRPGCRVWALCPSFALET